MTFLPGRPAAAREGLDPRTTRVCARWGAEARPGRGLRCRKGFLAGEIARAGWPVIVDRSFSRKSERDEVRALADRVGVVHATIWCAAPDPVIAERLERRAEDAGEVSDGRAALLAEHRARYEAPGGEPGVVRVDTEGEPDIDRVVESLERPV